MRLGNVSKQRNDKEIKLDVTNTAKDLLGEKGYDEVYGARPLRRVIQNIIEDKLSESVLRGGLKVFKRVYEAKATIKNSKISDDILKAIKAIPEKRAAEKEEDKYRIVPEILMVESAGDTISTYSSESIKYDIERIIREHLEETKKDERGKKPKPVAEFKVTDESYVSEVVVDVKDGEIVIDSRDSFSLPNVAVSAAKG